MPRIGEPVKGKPTAVGCYIFAGGFTVGVMKHFDVLCHLEGNNYGVAVARKNLKIPVHVGQGEWPVRDLAGRVDFLYGNPPCAAWSGNNPNSHKTGDGVGWEADPRVDCTRQLFGLLEVVRPKVWAWESVCQAPLKGKAFVDSLTRRALALGYSVSYLFHDAMYLGTPQTRKRWFMVCHRVKFEPAEPAWETVTASRALAEVKPRGGPASDGKHRLVVFADYLHKVPAGGRLRRFWEEVICPPGKQTLKPNGHVKGRCGFGHVRLHPDEVASATVGYSFVHPAEHRFCTLNEVQAIAGFPQSFDFGGKDSNGYAPELDLIARGVCPPVGEWLARGVAKALEKPVYVRKPTVTLYDFRKPGIDPVDMTHEFVPVVPATAVAMKRKK